MADTNVSCQMSGVASWLRGDTVSYQVPTRMTYDVPFAAQINHVCIDTTRNLDIDPNVHSREGIETTAKDLNTRAEGR
jgi:hypothetical protein